MRSTLFACALSLVWFAQANGSPLDPPPRYPEGVAEVSWGASPKVADKVMLARSGVKRAGEAEGRIRYQGGSLAGFPVKNWEFIFTEGRFTEAVIRLLPQEPLRQYEAIRKSITEKYRKSGREERENSLHRATYWEYATDRGKWGIACDVKPEGVLIVYKDKSPPPSPKKPGSKDL